MMASGRSPEAKVRFSFSFQPEEGTSIHSMWIPVCSSVNWTGAFSGQVFWDMSSFLTMMVKVVGSLTSGSSTSTASAGTAITTASSAIRNTDRLFLIDSTSF